MGIPKLPLCMLRECWLACSTALSVIANLHEQLASGYHMLCRHCSSVLCLSCREVVNGWRRTGMPCQGWGQVRPLLPVGRGRRRPPWPGPRPCWPSQPPPAPCHAGRTSVPPSVPLWRSPSQQVCVCVCVCACVTNSHHVSARPSYHPAQ